MIKINGLVYEEKKFEDNEHAGVRHLVIVIHGRLKTDDNKLTILYNGDIFYGIRILPHYDQEKFSTMFLVYVQ